MKKPIVIARFFATQLNKNINDFGIIGVSFNHVEANPISGQQPKFYFGFNDSGLRSLTISSYVRRDEFYKLGTNEAVAAKLDGQAECIT